MSLFKHLVPTILLPCMSIFTFPVLCQNSPKPCASVTARNKQEALKMEGASDKNGCWVRDKTGNLRFVRNASPDSGYKPLISKTEEDRGRPRFDPTVGVVGHGELAGEWHVRDEYFWVDNGDPNIQCRTGPYREYSHWFEEGSLIVGWDHIPQWKCIGQCRLEAFTAFTQDPNYGFPHVARLNETTPGTYVGEATREAMGDYRIFANEREKLRRTIVKASYKIVVTGNTFVGIFAISEDQSAQNGRHDVVCSEEVYNGERVLPKRP